MAVIGYPGIPAVNAALALALGNQIAAINAAIASGVTSISYDGKSATYRDFDDMIKTVAYLERQQARALGLRVPTVGRSVFSTGRHNRWRDRWLG